MVRTSEGVNGDEHRTNVGIDLGILPSFLEIFIDALVRDGGEEGHIGHADLLLLEALFPVCLQDIIRFSASYGMRMVYATATHLGNLICPALLGCCRGATLLARLLRGSLDTTVE